MELMKTQKDWLDYINRLQERERQKIISGGLNNWVLFLELSGLGYWIYPDIVDMQKHWITTLIGYTIFTNLSVTSFDIFNGLYRQDKINKFREPTATLDLIGTLPLKLHEKVMISVSLILNCSLAYHSYQKGIIFFMFFGMYFCVYSIRYLFQVIQMVNIYYKNKKSRMNESESSNLDEATDDIQAANVTNTNEMPLVLKICVNILRFLFGVVFKLIVTVLTFVYVCIHYDFNDILWKQVFDGLALTIIVILLQFLLMIFMKRMKIAWLEELEKKIILNNLSQDEIVNELNEGYFKLSGIDNYF